MLRKKLVDVEVATDMDNLQVENKIRRASIRKQTMGLWKEAPCLDQLWWNCFHSTLYPWLNSGSNYNFKISTKVNQPPGQWLWLIGRAFASDTRGPWFESTHQQNLYWTFLLPTALKRRKKRKKETGNCPFKKVNQPNVIDLLLAHFHISNKVGDHCNKWPALVAHSSWGWVNYTHLCR